MILIKPGNKYIVIGPYSRIDIAAALVALVVGVFIAASDSEWVYKAIGLFGMLALMIRASSRIPLVLTFICVISMPLAQILEQKWLLENLAISAFYFLLISITLLALESQPNRGSKATRIRVRGGIRSR